MIKLRSEDLTDKIFYPWHVIALNNRNSSGNICWLVRCLNCGLEQSNTLQNIKAGYGCRNCSLLPKGQSGLNKLYSTYKTQAKKCNRVFELELDHFAKLTSGVCFYCGSNPLSVVKCSSYYKKKSSWGNYIYNGIDRKNNEIGYIKSNCVTCCWRCNRTFGSLYSYEEKLILSESIIKIDKIRNH